MGFQSLEERLRVLQKQNGELQSALRSTPFRGTTTQRNDLFPLPTNDAQRAALANQQVVWFNTDLGWNESYYAQSGTTGLKVPGVLANVLTPAGWYPTGPGPRAQVFTAGVQARTAGNFFTNYHAFGANQKSFRNGGSGWFTLSGGYITMQVAGRYRVRAGMGVQNGTGTAVLTLRTYRGAGTLYVTQDYHSVLHGTYAQNYFPELGETLYLAGDYVGQGVVGGSLNIGQNETYLSVEYLGPPVESAP